MEIMSFSSADLAVSFSHLRTASSFGHGFEPYCLHQYVFWKDFMENSNCEGEAEGQISQDSPKNKGLQALHDLCP